jgi:hypothetical protein
MSDDTKKVTASEEDQRKSMARNHTGALTAGLGIAALLGSASLGYAVLKRKQNKAKLRLLSRQSGRH